MNKVLPLVSLFIISIISIFYWTFKPKNELYDAKWNAPDTTLAITINGEISTTFPTTNAYEASVECTNGTGKAEWNGTKWILTTSEITKGSTKCNAKFNKLTFAGTILANNEVKTPLTTPGAEVSAYTLDDVTTTSTYSVSSTDQSYYVTYGTGWKANGTKFNLTGTAVTTNTYANSYSSLVGKYLPNISILMSGSKTAGTMMTTTNLSSVYYVVSATSSSFTYKTISSNKNTTEALLASAEDDYGTSYYFRGAVKNNYVEFANKCWRIVRIGGDNTIKLILHNDNTSNTSSPCSSSNNNTTAAFAHYNGDTYTSVFNSNYADNAYVGFMYGTVDSSTYEATHANINKSTILTNLEIWYNDNLKTCESVIDDNVFCNDKTNVTDTSYDPMNAFNTSQITGLGYRTEGTYYAAYKRLYTNKTPSLKCNGTLSKITSKIGLITADEVVYAGNVVVTSGSTSYLQENATGSHWWSMTPSDYYVDQLLPSPATEAQVLLIKNDGSLNRYKVNISNAVRPVISLISSTTISGGTGTSEDPYVVK